MVQFSFPSSGVRSVCVALVVATSVLLAGVSAAQHDHALPTSPATIPVPLEFDSVLSRYQPMTDEKLGSWREANDTVTRIGGWRSYLKEAQTPDAKTASPTLTPVRPTTPASPNPHAGHGVKP